MTLPIVYHDMYDIPVPANHRFVGTKFSDLFSHLQEKEFISQMHINKPQRASRQKILNTHSVDYFTKVERGSLNREDLKKLNLPWSPRLQERSFLAIEGTYLAACLAMDNNIACHVAGGTHHAHKDYGSGFCVFNDLGYTAINLIKNKKAEKVLILDLDVHQGDGTIDVCSNYNNIFTCSVHSVSNCPFEKKRGSLDIVIPSKTTDDFYLQEVNKMLCHLSKKIKPDIVLYDAGVDIYEHDELGNLNITINGIFRRDFLVLEYFKKLNIPVATVIGGGYSQDRKELSRRHAIIFEVAHKVHFGNPT